MASKITDGQGKLIEKLSQQNDRNTEIIEKFLEKNFKHSVSDLTMQEASRLIESLKKLQDNPEHSNPPPVTAKQIALLKRLQDGNERIEKLKQMLLKLKKDNINELTVPEASSVIDALISTKAGSNEERGKSPATEKQVKFLEKLYASENNRTVIEGYLARRRKKSLDELTRSEAGELLDSLVETTR
ncbi:MAG: hypothetical protein M1327_02320 [Candidatus Thermoplasmatota archaeon]|nr:hypothetical protein [Candidatus Thermoplasmatota archaeon]